MTRRSTSASFLLSVLMAGCGGSRPNYVPVGGTVSLNGKPFGNAEIRFVPDPGNMWITAGIDTTGPAGNYKLMSSGRSGLSPGKYKVLIAEKPAVSSASDDMADDPGMRHLSDLARSEGKGKVAAKKAEPIKGMFDAEVTADQGIYDFDVKVAVK